MKTKIGKNGIFWLILFIFCILSCTFSKPLFLRPDATLYYSFIRSLYFDGDLFFLNEYDHLNVDPQWYFLTPTGYLGNPHSVGVSVLLYPFFVVGDVFTIISRLLGYDLLRDGYSFFYTFFVQFGSRLYFFAGILIFFPLLNKMFGKRSSIMALLLIWIFSPVGFQFMLTPTMSHLCSFFTVTFFISAWDRSRDNRNLTDWLTLGLAIGFMTMIRINNILFTVILLIEYVFDKKKRIENFKPVGIFICAVAALTTFSPQLAVWKILSGSWIWLIEGNLIRFSDNNLHLSLFSAYHGLFSWTPLLLICFIGFRRALQKDSCMTMGLFIVFIMQLILIGFLSNWWADLSFGNRFFINVLPLFILLLGASFNSISWKLLIPLIGVSCIWTSGLFVLVISRIIDLNFFYPYPDLIKLWLKIPILYNPFFHNLWSFFSYSSCLLTIFIVILISIGRILFIRYSPYLQFKLWCILGFVTCFGVLIVMFFQIMCSSETGQYQIHASKSQLEKYSDKNKFNFDLNAMRKTLQFRILYDIKRENFNDALQESHVLLDKYTDDNGYYYLGYTFGSMKNWKEAEYYYRVFLKSHPESVKVKLNLGALLAETGNYRDAKNLFQEVLLQEPNNEIAKKNLELCEK